MRRRRKRGVYGFILTIPDRLYPFGALVDGEFVRGARSYERALRIAFQKYGRGHYGTWLTFYRSLFHIMGSVLVIIGAGLVSQYFLGSSAALYIVMLLVALFITFQEFYLQRADQCRRKSVVDWFSWVGPMLIFLLIH